MSAIAVFLVLVIAVWTYVTLWFVIARLMNRTDVVDTAWGLGFVLVAWLAWLLAVRHPGLRLLAVEFVSLWGIRLSGHITLRNLKKPEDHRYAAYREKWGDSFWLKAYTRIFLVQGLLILVISLPVTAVILAAHSSWHWVAAVGFAVWAGGIVIETEADAELSMFVRTKKPGQIMQSGLWRYSRHPNYFGEVVAWCGAAIVAIAYGQWWGIIGAAVITFLITKVSGIPPLEKHYKGNKAFAAYKKRTSILLPLPPKR